MTGSQFLGRIKLLCCLLTSMTRTVRHFVYADQDLVSFGSHHFNYCAAVAGEFRSRGIATTVLANRGVDERIRTELSAVPFFSTHSYSRPGPRTFAKLCGDWVGPLQIVSSNFQVYRELRAARAQFVDPDTLIFAASCNYLDLAAWLRWMGELDKRCRPNLVIMLRFSPYGDGWLDTRLLFYRTIFRLLKNLILSSERCLHFVSDSRALANCYEKELGITVDVVPIPHATMTACAPGVGSFISSPVRPPLRLIVPGQIRKEKGYDLLLRMVPFLRQHKNSLRITVHIGSPHRELPNSRIDSLVAQITESALFEIIAGNLSTTDYLNQISTADAVLLPYNRIRYRYRTSGPFIEAAAAGIPLVIPIQTWMTTTATEYNLAFIPFDTERPKSLEQALLLLIKNILELKERGRTAMYKIRAHHNPSSFVNRLLEKTSNPSSSIPPTSTNSYAK